MNLSAYPDLLRTRGVSRLLASALVARTPVMMLVIPLSFLVKDLTGTFAWSGAVVATHSVAAAIGSPWWSRRADRRGARRVLGLTGLVWGTTVMVLGFATGLSMLFPLAALTGLMIAPVAAMLRSAWPRVVAGGQLRTAYTLDATAQELMFVVGPMSGALLVSLASPRAGLLVAGSLAIVGTSWFSRQEVIDTAARPVEQHLGFRETVLVRVRLLILVAFTLCVTGFAAVSIGIVVFAEHHDWRLLAGILESVWAVGSFLGGLVAGSLPGVRTTHAWRRCLLAGAGFALCGVATGNELTLAVALFAAGSLLAPVVATLYERLGALTVEAARAEVFGWMSTGGLIGGAAGSALAGVVAEQFGVAMVFAMAGVLMGAAALLLAPVPPLARNPIQGDARSAIAR